MAIDIIARLRLRGEEFSRQFRDRMDDVDRQARAAATRIGNSFAALGRSGAAAIGAIGVAGLAAAAKGAFDYADAIADLAAQTGATTKLIQEFRYAAQLSGSSVENADAAIGKFAKTLGEAQRGSKAQAELLASLGVKSKDFDRALRETIAGISKLDTVQKQNAVSLKLFGKSAADLVPLLGGGTRGFDELAVAAGKLGIVMDDKLIKNAGQVNDKLDALKMTLTAQMSSAVVANADSIMAVANAVSSAANAFARFSSTNPKLLMAIMGASAGSIAGPVGMLEGARRGYNAATEREQQQRALAEAPAQIQALAKLRAQRKAIGDKQGADAYARRIVEIGRDSGFTAQVRARSSAPPPDLETGTLPPASGKPKGGAGKSDAQQNAERLAKEYERITQRLAEQATESERAARSERLRADGLGDIAEQEEAIAEVRSRNSDLAGKTAAQVAKEFGVTVERAQAEIDILATLEQQALARVKGEQAAKREVEITTRLNDAFTRKVNDDLAASQALDRAKYEAAENERQRQRAMISDLADFYRSAFDRGTGDLWDNFKRMGKDAIATIAAEYTLAMLSGQKVGSFASVAGSALQGNPLGSLLGSVFGGGGGAAGLPGGAAGGGAAGALAPLGAAYAGGQIVGKVTGSKTAGNLTSAAALAATGGPVGVAAAALLVATTFLKSTKRGSATIGFDGNGLGITSTEGNSAKRIAAATSSSKSVITTLQSIAERLGATISNSGSVTLGIRNGDYRVDPTGRGNTKTKKGAIDFGEDQEAAARFAVSDLLKDGVLGGISDASKTILQRAGGEIEAALEKAIRIESIPRLLKAELDPLGSAIDELNREFAKTVDAMKEGGASAEQMAQAQQLYNLQLARVKAETPKATAELEAFRKSLGLGGNETYSLRDRLGASEADLKPYLDAIASGQKIDQNKYLEAAQQFLTIQRDLNGSTEAYFEAQRAIEAATAKAIASFDNVTPIGGSVADPFAVKTADSTAATASATQATADMLQQANATLFGMQQLLAKIAAGGGGPSSFLTENRSFV